MQDRLRLQPLPWTKRITSDLNILDGTPIVRGTRVPVELVLEILARDLSAGSLLEKYPELTPDDVKACLEFAESSVRAGYSTFGWYEA
jgi:uncharacterized protein (DUF433 family)